MKCPKCGYLGFETGNRCKHCGYDFGLLTSVPPDSPPDPDPDLNIKTDDAETHAPEVWLDRLDRSMDEASEPKEEHLAGVPEREPSETLEPDSRPYFRADDPDAIPLIALPSAPRAPLAVRRTPEPTRLRAVPKAARATNPKLFPEEPQTLEAQPERPEVVMPAARGRRREGPRRVGGRRLLAGLIDHGILLAIDLTVVYFTLRMAGLSTAEFRLVPPLPLLAFVGMLKVAYFSAFTAVSGQTIGKMAVGIRVVGDRGPIDGGVAVRRTLATLLSLLPFGIGLLPAFFGRRTLHDRLTHTRVVGLPSA